MHRYNLINLHRRYTVSLLVKYVHFVALKAHINAFSSCGPKLEMNRIQSDIPWRRGAKVAIRAVPWPGSVVKRARTKDIERAGIVQVVSDQVGNE